MATETQYAAGQAAILKLIHDSAVHLPGMMQHMIPWDRVGPFALTAATVAIDAAAEKEGKP